MKLFTRALIIGGIIATSFVQAQVGNNMGTLNESLRVTGRYKDTEGSPYLIDEYTNGTLIDKSGNKRAVYLKYDTYKEELLVFNDGTPLMIDKRLYPKFIIEYVDDRIKKTYAFTNEVQVPGLKPDKYVQMLVDGDTFKFFKTYDAILNQSQDQGYGGVVTNNYFENRESYYIYQVGLDAVEVKLKSKDVLKALSDDGAIKDFLKKEKLKIRNEEDMIEFVEILNTDKSPLND